MSEPGGIKDYWNGLSPEARKAAKWGAVGAVIAIPVPFVGPIIGGIVGSGLGYAKAKGKI